MSDKKELSQKDLEQVTGGSGTIAGGDVELGGDVHFKASNQDDRSQGGQIGTLTGDFTGNYAKE